MRENSRSVLKLSHFMIAGLMGLSACTSDLPTPDSEDNKGGPGNLDDPCAEKAIKPFDAPPPPAPTGRIYSFGVSPFGFSQSTTAKDFYCFYNFLGSLKNGAVLAGTPWRDDTLGVSNGGGAVPANMETYKRMGATYEFEPIYIFGWKNDSTLLLNQPAPGDTTNSWNNTQTRAKMKSMLVSFVSTYSPRYVFIGNEVNDHTGADYSAWVSFFAEAYDAIKAANPSVQVGTIFQHESLSGNTLLSQGSQTPDWNKLTAFNLSKIDVIGLTLYPFFQYADPKDVPTSYLDSLTAITGSKPLFITETGWPARDDFPSPAVPLWKTSPQAQVDYIVTLDRVLTGKNVSGLGWLFYHSVDDGSGADSLKMFSSIALHDKDGSAFASAAEWISRANQ